jgi:hypothetical protein
MRRSIFKPVAAVAAFAATLGASGAAYAAKPPPPGTNFGGCTTAFTNPDALACAGYFSSNLLNNSTPDLAFQDQFLGLLPGGAGAFDGTSATWNSLVKIDADNGASPIDFGMTLYGLTFIGAHFGNAAQVSQNNVSVFWLIDFGTTGGKLTLADPQGWSNAILYKTGTPPPPPSVPEPATWAMMLLGFGAAGTAIRRSRRKETKLLQIA